MSDQSITLTPTTHDKLGALHCGVTRVGFVVVGGDVHDIADGEDVYFARAHVKVHREGEEYTFSRTA